MKDFSKLSEKLKETSPGLSKAFEELGKIQAEAFGSKQVNDSKALKRVEPLRVSTGTIESLQDSLYEDIRAKETALGAITLDELRDKTRSRVTKMVADSFYNDFSGIGTQRDPGFYNTADVPITMSPQEVTANYSSGGIPQIIVDKKAGGVIMNGYQFLSDSLSEADCELIKRHSEDIGFNKAQFPAYRDGIAYGGSLLVPHLRGENVFTMESDLNLLKKMGMLEKGCIERFWHADRWNAVMIPDYNISASDYIFPREIFVPITGYSVNTTRAAILRPNILPYWGTLRQMGWGISDMQGWIRSVLAYEVCIESIPIMAQQMSLLFRMIPAEGILAANGGEFFQELAEKTSFQLTRASNVQPQTLNSVGEIQVVNRNFQGFGDLIQILRQDVGAQSKIADSILFNTQASGFSDNKEDVTLKQTETYRQIANTLESQLKPIVEMLVYSTFGADSPQGRLAHTVRIDFNTPQVLTNSERAQAGATFAQIFTAGINGQMQTGHALELAKAFAPDVEIPQAVIDAYTAEPGLNDEADDGLGNLVDRLQRSPIAKLASRLEPSGSDNLADRVGPKGAENLAERVAPEPSPGVKALTDKINPTAEGAEADPKDTLAGMKERVYGQASDSIFRRLVRFFRGRNV